jgi:hypothetical protein
LQICGESSTSKRPALFNPKNQVAISSLNDPEPAAGVPCDLESVIVTHELSSRKSRRSDNATEDRAVLELVSELSKTPNHFFQKLVDAALYLSGADSTGITVCSMRNANASSGLRWRED